MNELGYDSAPYNSISTFALEPVYLRLQDLRDVDLIPFERKIRNLKSKFKSGSSRIDYGIKKAKLDLLNDIYLKTNLKDNSAFNAFVKNNKYWLTDYAVYKFLKKKNDLKSWEEWKKGESRYSKKTVNEVLKKHKKTIYFHYWVQWQLFEQMKETKAYASKNGVLIMGDMPFLVSKDSVDIWSHQKYFKLNLSAGAPPDMYFAFGQKWGMPPYNWNNISNDKYVYIKERIKYAENFYDMYRIDHFVGLFRIWTIGPASSSKNEQEKLYSKFDPESRNKWENHGKKIIKAMLSVSSMLPCAEDLGTVPKCSYTTLKEYGIPGIDFQRFYKKKKKDYEFVTPDDYRKNSSAVISTHDTSFFPQWWNYEAGTIDKALFEYLCRLNNIKGKTLKGIKDRLFDKRFSKKGRLYWKKDIRSVNVLLNILNIKESRAKKIVSMYKDTYGEKEKFIKYLYGKNTKFGRSSPALQKKCIEKVSESESIFSIQLVQEYLYMNKNIFDKTANWNYRINMPGIINQQNWALKLPLSLESILNSGNGNEISVIIKRINEKNNRL